MTKEYQPEMTEKQLAFFRALTAPFPDESLSEKPGRGGKPMTWLDKRALENRLDSVCTPLGWTIEYRPTNRGFTSRMGILCPTDDGEWVWVFKEDGAGYEEMDSVDDDEKSGYTNALRRVAQDAWGIGRYLYRKGLPSFADRTAEGKPELPPYVAPTATLPPAAKVEPTPEPKGRFGNPSPTPPVVESPAPIVAPQPPPVSETHRPQPVAQPPSTGIDPVLLKIPEAGRPMFAWVKGIEDHYQTAIKNGVIADAEKLGGSRFMNQWSQEIVNQVTLAAINHVRTLDNYQGEFETLVAEPPSGNAPPLPNRAVQSPAPTATAGVASLALTAPSPTSPEIQAIQDARSRLAATLIAYIGECHGDSKPTPAKLKGFIAEMSPDVPTGSGNTGEVMLSVGACNDVVWLEGITNLILNEVKMHREKLAAEASAKPVNPDIPF
jgi:hypothetical protein